MHRHLVVAAVVAPLFALSFATPSFAQAGEGEGEGAAAGEGEGEGANGCGAVTPQGDCNGTQVEFCSNANGTPHVVTYDCAATPYVNATCGTVNTEYGVDCIVPSGQCFFVDPNGGQALAACATATDACDLTGTTTSTCSPSTACSDTDNGTCNGTVYTACSFIVQAGQSDGQRLTLDCAVLGGACKPDDNTDPANPILGGCFSAPGAACTPTIGACGTGPTDPNVDACPASGFCPTSAGEGEGEGGAAEGEGEGEAGKGGGCACNTSSTGSAGFFALALLGGVLVKARRKR